MKERTLIILKPCCIQRGLSGEVISRFEKKGLKIAAIKFAKISIDKAKEHYKEHEGKPFFNDLIDYITSGPVILMILEADNVIKLARTMAGATKVEEAVPGTIRGDYVSHTPKNIVHTSDSQESAEREIALFFDSTELLDYEKNIDKWI